MNKMINAKLHFPATKSVFKSVENPQGSYELLNKLAGVEMDVRNAVYKAITKNLLRNSISDTKYLTFHFLLDAGKIMRDMYSIAAIRVINFLGSGQFSSDQSPFSLQPLGVYVGKEGACKDYVKGLLNFLRSVSMIKIGEDRQILVRFVFSSDYACVVELVDLPKGTICIWCGATE